MQKIKATPTHRYRGDYDRDQRFHRQDQQTEPSATSVIGGLRLFTPADVAELQRRQRKGTDDALS